MTLTIGPKTYEMESLDRVTILDLVALKLQTRDYTEDGKGLTLNYLEENLSGKNAAEAETDLLAFGAFIFLVRRRAGENISFEEALDFPIGDLVFDNGDSADVEAGEETPDPTSAA